MKTSPILATILDNKLHRGETDFAEMCAWDGNARQLRNVADLLTELAADCVIERRRGEAIEEHAYARIRAAGHYDLSRELMAIIARLAEMETKARVECQQAREEYDLGRQIHLAGRKSSDRDSDA